MHAPLASCRSGLILLTALTALLCLPADGATQPVGTFRWQMQPYCNVVTISVVQHGAVFQLLGSDDLCGTGAAPVVGTAVPTGGSVALGLTVSPPTGGAVHVSATVSLATVSGTWTDADGHRGTFAFNGNGAGAPRPAPASAAVIVPSQFAAAVYAGSGAAATVARSDHTHALADLPRASVDHTEVYTNRSIAAGTCMTSGLGDGRSGAFRDGGLVIATWVTPVNQNLGLYPATTRSIQNGFGVASYLICNSGTVAIALDGTVVVRLTVVR